MHPSKTYRTTPERENLLFAEQRGFGVWVINGTADDDNMPVIATAPFYLDKTSHESGHVLPTVKAHLMKDNTLVQRLRHEPSGVINCTIIVSGPDGYVSPDWYEMADQVPTWNYVTIHLKGQLRLLPDEDLHDVLDNLSQRFEEAFSEDKPAWKIDKMPPVKLKAMMHVLAPIALQITSVEGTWKVAQAKPQQSREKVAVKMAHYSQSKPVVIGMELAALSVLHQAPFTAGAADQEIKNMLHSRDETAVTASAVTPLATAAIQLVFVVMVAYLLQTNTAF